MGIVGWGRAFNLRFMPNGPLRTNCYHRPMPRVGIFGGGGNMSYTENINIQNGPTGFWGFMTGLSQGLFGGGMFGMGMGGLFGGGLFGMGGYSPYAALNSAQIKQGAEQPNAEDKYLTSLTSVLGAKGTFAKHPDNDYIYIMTTKDGEVIEDTYQNLLDKFKKQPEVKKNDDNEESGAELKAEEAQRAQEEAKAEAETSIKESKSRHKKIDNGGRAQETAHLDENAYKNKVYPVRIGVQSSWSFGTCTYTATGTFTDDKGVKHDINLQQQKVDVSSWSFGSGPSDAAISKDIIPKLKAKAAELGFPNLKFILPKDIANAGNSSNQNNIAGRSRADWINEGG